MKNYTFIILFFIAVLFSCCTKESVERTDHKATSVVSEDSAYLCSFAQILSSAVYSEPALRDFIKSEALKEFDKDHDVFYPLVKNKVVSEGKTFREILKKYDYDDELDRIEFNEPLLNIFVPDCSWVSADCFSPQKWDVANNEVAIAVSNGTRALPLYGNGKRRGSIKRNEYPTEPILVVKRNERLVYNQTKSSPVYEFKDPEYDGSLEPETKGTWHYHTYEYSTTNPDDYVLYYYFPARVKQAYYEALNTYTMPQRDYIYYNMTASCDTGSVDRRYSERLYKFRFSEGNVSALYDDYEVGNDATLSYAGSPGQVYEEGVLKEFGWDDGNLEVVFHVVTGTQESRYHKDVQMKDAFTPKKVYFEWYKNIFGTVTYRHYYVQYEDLVPKWIMLDWNLFCWDLLRYPYFYDICIDETDSGVTINKSHTDTYEFVTNINVSGEQDQKIGWGTGITTSNTYQQTAYLQTTNVSDDLGEICVHYDDPIIVNIPNPVCKIYRYTTGYVDFMIIPTQTY